jgi:hypothetical protein
MDVLLADPDKPISPERKSHQLTKMYIALDRIEKGAGADVEDLALVSDAVEMTHRFYHHNVTTLEAHDAMQDDIQIARRALVDAYKHWQADDLTLLTGTGMQAIRRVMDTYYALMEVVPERRMIEMHRETEKANRLALSKGEAFHVGKGREKKP